MDNLKKKGENKEIIHQKTNVSEIEEQIMELITENQNRLSQKNKILTTPGIQSIKRYRFSLIFTRYHKIRKFVLEVLSKMKIPLLFINKYIFRHYFPKTNLLEQKHHISLLHEDNVNKDQVHGGNNIIALFNPDWLGIQSSTQQLFDTFFPLRDNIDNDFAQQFSLILKEQECTHLVIQGFPLSYKSIVQQVNKNSPSTKVYVIWHGGFIQTDEDYAWNAFKEIESLCRNGLIWKWGFVKDGMADIMAKNGLRTGFVMNYVKHIPECPSIIATNNIELGIWSSTRKPPYAMMAASKLVEGASIHTWGNRERIKEFADLLNIDGCFEGNIVDPNNMNEVLTRFCINLYVSLYECAPMLPLESLSVGVPCLFGPHSHYFEDDTYLKSRLVVPCPDRSDNIARYIQQAVLERSQIIEAYREYAPRYNNKAIHCLHDFLDL